MARRIIYNNKKNGSFPLTYVVDIAEMMIDEKRVVDVVDYKNPCSAELSIGHNLVRAIHQFKEIEKE
ncbi:MAG: hypothetical protein IKC11_00790 [Clostridia bacterium]|nr:hypothetical protein [Clostridia bacterium]